MRPEIDGPAVLVTCDAESDAIALEELRRIGQLRLPGQWLDTGDAVQGSILLAESDIDFSQLAKEIDRYGSVFVRHVAPVDYRLELQGAEADLDRICSLVPALAARMDSSLSFSVQTRILGEGKLPYRKVVVNETLSQRLEAATGATMDCRWPKQVVSILCSPTTAFAGLSRTDQNRSAWPGGKHRFKRDDNQISRAEFKLLEAISVFGLDLPAQGRALDIGASPGGWTRVLAAHGLHIDAVDPGDLDPRLKGNRLVTYYRRRIQEFRPQESRGGTKPYDVIVNDMKMDARDSIEIMLSFSNRLASGGVALMTLKMPKFEGGTRGAAKVLDMLRADLERLEYGYDLIGARQLYHNRSEVTVALTSRQRAK